MWIVRLALRRPYTFIVMAIVIMILGALSIIRTPKDIFPNINIPVVTFCGITRAFRPSRWRTGFR